MTKYTMDSHTYISLIRTAILAHNQADAERLHKEFKAASPRDKKVGNCFANDNTGSFIREAAAAGDLETLKFLHENGADLNSVSIDTDYVPPRTTSNTPLIEAVAALSVECVQYLLQQGASTLRTGVSVRQTQPARHADPMRFPDPMPYHETTVSDVMESLAANCKADNRASLDKISDLISACHRAETALSAELGGARDMATPVTARGYRPAQPRRVTSAQNLIGLPRCDM